MCICNIEDSVEVKLKKYFDDKCVNIKVIALKCGMSRTTLAKSLSGVRELKANELIAICREMKIPLSFFN